MKYTKDTWKSMQMQTCMDKNIGKRIRLTTGKYKGRCATIHSNSLNQDGSYIITLESIPLRFNISIQEFVLLQ